MIRDLKRSKPFKYFRTAEFLQSYPKFMSTKGVGDVYGGMGPTTSRITTFKNDNREEEEEDVEATFSGDNERIYVNDPVIRDAVNVPPISTERRTVSTAEIPNDNVIEKRGAVEIVERGTTENSPTRPTDNNIGNAHTHNELPNDVNRNGDDDVNGNEGNGRRNQPAHYSNTLTNRRSSTNIGTRVGNGQTGSTGTRDNASSTSPQPNESSQTQCCGPGQRALKKDEEERRRFECTHRTMVAVREEMKRTNDIMTSYLIHQEKSGQKEALFMALQVIPRDSDEYRTLSRQLISSVSGGSNVHDIRRNFFPSISHGSPTWNGVETAAGERHRTGSRRRSEGFCSAIALERMGYQKVVR